MTDSDIKDGRNDTLFFRGQKTNFWKVQPSIFRDDCLAVEHELMQQPLIHVPNEFSKDMELFEVMAKYQHYGMCTRLLDLTTNPLVALYFACNSYGKVK
ncbi:MAG: FRG domain-containing protein [Selenomonadaceae bacterium]|nr:FRG domain-containing protein [Selenomonadaceae bacterium]